MEDRCRKSDPECCLRVALWEVDSERENRIAIRRISGASDTAIPTIKIVIFRGTCGTVLDSIALQICMFLANAFRGHDRSDRC